MMPSCISTMVFAISRRGYRARDFRLSSANKSGDSRLSMPISSSLTTTSIQPHVVLASAPMDSVSVLIS